MSQPARQWPWPEMLGLQKPLFPTSQSLHLRVCNMGSHYFQDRTSQSIEERLVSMNDPHQPQYSATQRQQQPHLEAIGVLKDEVDRCIFAGLDVARSFESRFQHGSDHACLTRDQVNAIRALRHCKDSDIRTWLHYARAPGTPCGHYELVES